jgi:hypothetical protein
MTFDTAKAKVSLAAMNTAVSAARSTGVAVFSEQDRQAALE